MTMPPRMRQREAKCKATTSTMAWAHRREECVLAWPGVGLRAHDWRLGLELAGAGFRNSAQLGMASRTRNRSGGIGHPPLAPPSRSGGVWVPPGFTETNATRAKKRLLERWAASQKSRCDICTIGCVRPAQLSGFRSRGKLCRRSVNPR